MSVKKALDEFGEYVRTQSQQNLKKEGKNVSGNLYNSIDYFTKESKNSFQLDILMDDYGKFVDKGVKGFSSSAKAPNSPFKFGSGSGKSGGLTKGINKWVRLRRFQFRNRQNGQFMSYESTAFLVVRSVWHKGIETTNFLTTPFEEAFKRLPDDIVEAYSLEVDTLFKTSLV